MGSRITSEDSEGGRADHTGKGVTVGRSPRRKRVPDMQGRSSQANLPEEDSDLSGDRGCGSEYHRGARCGKTARRDLCGGRRVTGVPTATGWRRPTGGWRGSVARADQPGRQRAEGGAPVGTVPGDGRRACGVVSAQRSGRAQAAGRVCPRGRGWGTTRGLRVGGAWASVAALTTQWSRQGKPKTLELGESP